MTKYLMIEFSCIIKIEYEHSNCAPAGYILTCTTAFLVKVAVWALREALPIQQHVGRPAGCAVMWALPLTPRAGPVASWKEDKSEEMIRTATNDKCRSSVSPVNIPGLE